MAAVVTTLVYPAIRTQIHQNVVVGFVRDLVGQFGLEILEFQTVAVIGLAAVRQPQCSRGRFSGSIGIPPQGRIFLCAENPHRTYGTHRKQHENTQNPCHCTLSHHISLSFSFSFAMKAVTERQSTKNPASLMLCQCTIISSFKSSRGDKNHNFCLTVRNFRPLVCAVYSLLKQIFPKYFHPNFPVVSPLPKAPSIRRFPHRRINIRRFIVK